MKILILKPSSLGDVIHAMPVLRLLRRHHPGSQIFWWIDAGLAPLLEGDPDLSGVLLFQRKRWSKPRHWPEMFRAIRELRAHRFDLVIDLQSLARSGIFAWLANGKLLVGLDDAREGANGFYDIIVRRPSYHTHAVDWYLSALPPLGVKVEHDFNWLPQRTAVAASVKTKWNLTGARWIALQPGARWMNKRWPVAHFTRFVKLASDAMPDAKFAIFGGNDDATLGEEISRAVPDRCLNLAGKTTLPEMIELLRLCELLVTNDTGPMHVAVALDKPVIGIFGPTEPRRTGPYGQMENTLRHPLPCAPCMKSECACHNPMECLTAITPEKVLQQVMRLLASQTTARTE